MSTHETTGLVANFLPEYLPSVKELLKQTFGIRSENPSDFDEFDAVDATLASLYSTDKGMGPVQFGSQLTLGHSGRLTG
jgi:hypothetical protein